MSTFFTWFPRILGICYSLFIASFSLDVFSEVGGVWQKILGFLIHLIPAVVTVICLLVAWHYRILGGLLYIVVGMVFMIYFGSWRDTLSFVLITLPMVVAGVFFILSQWNLPLKPAQQ